MNRRSYLSIPPLFRLFPFLLLIYDTVGRSFEADGVQAQCLAFERPPRSWNNCRNASLACESDMNWVGVECDGNRLVALQLSGRNTGGTLSPRLANATALRILYFNSHYLV